MKKTEKQLTKPVFFWYSLTLQGCLYHSAATLDKNKKKPTTSCGCRGGRKMKRTFQPKKIHRAKKHGFLARSKSSDGRKVLAARRRKGRAKLAA